MAEILTLEQIEERFPSEWVLLEDPELNENQEVLRGRLLWHSKDRDEVDDKALELRPKSSALFYTGPFPADMEVVL